MFPFVLSLTKFSLSLSSGQKWINCENSGLITNFYPLETIKSRSYLALPCALE